MMMRTSKRKEKFSLINGEMRNLKTNGSSSLKKFAGLEDY